MISMQRLRVQKIIETMKRSNVCSGSWRQRAKLLAISFSLVLIPGLIGVADAAATPQDEISRKIAREIEQQAKDSEDARPASKAKKVISTPRAGGGKKNSISNSGVATFIPDPSAVKKEAEAHYEAGSALYKNNKYPEAQAEYQKAAELNPANDLYLIGLGKALYAQNKYAEAADKYRAAIKLRPGNASYHNLLGVVLFGQKNRGEAELAFREAVRLDKKDDRYHINLIYSLFISGTVARAEDECQKWVQREPSNALYHNCLGFVLSLQGKEEGAEEEYRKAVRLNQSSARYHNALGYTLTRRRKYAEAETEISAAVRIEPQNALYRARLGEVLWRQYKDELAEDHYREATKIAPDEAEYHTAFGFILAERRKYKDAESEFQKALEIDKKSYEALNHLGYYRMLQNQQNVWPFNESLRMIQQAKNAEEKNPIFLDSLGWAYFNLSLLDEAERYLTEAARSTSTSERFQARNQEHLGDLYNLRGKADQARAAWQKAYSLLPLSGDTGQRNILTGKLNKKEPLRLTAKQYFDSGVEYYKSEKYALAEAEYWKAVSLDDKSAEYHFSLGRALQKLDKDVAAERELRKAVELDGGNALYRVWLGVVLSRSRKYVEAEAEFSNAVNHQPNSVSYHYLLGMVLWLQYQDGRAEAQFREAVKLEKDNKERAQYHTRLGIILAERHKYAEAEDEFEKALRNDPKLPHALNYLGYYRLERDQQLIQSLQLIQQALNAEPEEFEFLDTLGWAYLKLKRFDEAEFYLSRAARNTKVWERLQARNQEHLGELYANLGKTDQARKAWQKALSLTADTAFEQKKRLVDKLNAKSGQ